ncbi:site-specific DNA-methyltransferase [Streptococcus suis]|nr:site-specific DNA-methyltransferase [Streptococcus suis]
MPVNNNKRCNDLSGKEWLQNSFSIWRDLRKTKEEKDLGHPASFPVSLVEKLLLTFSKQNQIVLDPFNGVGTTMVGAINTNRKGIGIELSEEFYKVSLSRIDRNDNIKVFNGDSFELIKMLEDNTVDICITSPPYWDILNMHRSADKKEAMNYSDKDIDLGNEIDYDVFISKLGSLFGEVGRVLKPGSYCLVNVMDIRKKSNFYPLHMDLATELKQHGYIFDDLIIWDRQSDYNNMRPLGYPYKFRINKVHEYILIFVKE